MKNYAKNQYKGNLNKWSETEKETLSVHTMNDVVAATLNKQFDSTGIKYEETDIAPHEFKKEAKSQTEIGDGEAPKDDAKPEVKKASKQTKKKAEIV